MENNFFQNKEQRRLNWLYKPVSLWLSILFLLVGFSGGILAGTVNAGQNQQKVIKGAEVASLSDISVVSSTASSTDSDLPDYLKRDVDFSLYWDVWNIIKNNYYNKEVIDTELFYGSLKGLVASLSDPYSIFMTPSDASDFAQDMKGTFEGIGAEISIKNGQLTVVSPLDDSPAMKAGLRPKDFILAVNGTSTEGLSIDQAVNLIRGDKGTEVILTIFREGWSETQDIKIIRDKIIVKSVTWEYKENGTVAWVKVRQFNEDTIPLFNKFIEEVNFKPLLKGVVLDLRSNPGGYLEVAVQMAGEWGGDKVVVIERNRDNQENPHHAFINARLAKYKTVVLVNGGSASGSEIVAGALQDWEMATLVGTTTFGKGSVQELNYLSDGSQVKLTIAKWFTPNDRSIDEAGIEPDIEVELTEEDYDKDRDPQLDKALELLK